MTEVIARVHPVHLMNVDWAPGGRQPPDLGCESAENWQLLSTSTIAMVITTQSISWYSFYRPTKGGRLSRPRHCSKGAQPVPKTVYRSSCHDKHNCRRRGSNLGPVTPQSDALTVVHGCQQMTILNTAVFTDARTTLRVFMARSVDKPSQLSIRCWRYIRSGKRLRMRDGQAQNGEIEQTLLLAS